MNGSVEYQDIGISQRRRFILNIRILNSFQSGQFKGTRDKENGKASQTRVGIRSIAINARRQIKIHGNENLFREESSEG
jgi:hypothetical protein